MYKALILTAALTALAIAVEQPIPYSHKTHLTMGLKCNGCHTNPDPGEMMKFPAVATCMGCHNAVKTDSPHIQKLAAASQEKKEIRWVRVYQIPGYVSFNHRLHTEGGVTCETCHGPVRERDVLTKEVKQDMGTCMACHSKMKVSNDCTFCHEARN